LHLVDPPFGEWFREIQPDGTITGNRTDECKGPHHHAWACGSHSTAGKLGAKVNQDAFSRAFSTVAGNLIAAK